MTIISDTISIFICRNALIRNKLTLSITLPNIIEGFLRWIGLRAHFAGKHWIDIFLIKTYKQILFHCFFTLFIIFFAIFIILLLDFALIITLFAFSRVKGFTCVHISFKFETIILSKYFTSFNTV